MLSTHIDNVVSDSAARARHEYAQIEFEPSQQVALHEQKASHISSAFCLNSFIVQDYAEQYVVVSSHEQTMDVKNINLEIKKTLKHVF